jgi:hypothetical protein
MNRTLESIRNVLVVASFNTLPPHLPEVTEENNELYQNIRFPNRYFYPGSPEYEGVLTTQLRLLVYFSIVMLKL